MTRFTFLTRALSVPENPGSAYCNDDSFSVALSSIFVSGPFSSASKTSADSFCKIGSERSSSLGTALKNNKV